MADGLAQNNEFDFFWGSNAKHYMDLTAYRLDNTESDFLSSVGSVIGNVTGKIKGDASSVIDYDYSNIISDAKQLISDGKITSSISNFVKSYTDIVESGGTINKLNPEYVFRLPIPQNLESQLTHKYDSDRQDITNVLNSSKKGGEEKENEFFKLMGKSKTGALAKVGGFAMGLANSFVSNAGDIGSTIMQRQMNVSLNPHLITVYEDTDLRTFRYSTPIVPYSKLHSQKISLGIAKLKEICAGSEMENDVGLFIQQPYIFTLSFGSRDTNIGASLNKEISELLRISKYNQFNITAININYSKGNMLFMQDGLPKLFEMTISLQERMPYRRGFFEKSATENVNKEAKK